MRFATLSLLSLALLACGKARPIGSGLEGSADGGTTTDGFALSCAACHGSDQSPAPPTDLLGQSDPTMRGVGAHQSHLVATHHLSSPIACTACHVVPATADAPGHMGDWPAKVVFSGLAVADGAQPTRTAPQGTGDSRADASLKVTCSGVYCHGATMSGGVATAPVWNTPDPKWTACGACHGNPPPTTRSGKPHTASTNCSSCHGQTVAADGTIAHPEKHIDGVVEVVGGGACNGCHGNLAVSNPPPGDPNTAPPVDTLGRSDTALVTVGAHQSHLKAAHGLSSPVACSECHTVPAAVDSPGHDIGQPAAVIFGTLSKSDGAAPTWTVASATCTAYCHGQTLGGGSNTTPTWTKVDNTQAVCGACHGLPPPVPHPPSTTCSDCHDTVGPTNVTIAKPAQHIDGAVETLGGITCHTCHGSTDNDAPPKDTLGNNATTFVGVGAHQSHLSAVIGAKVACTECHAIPTSFGHSNGVVDFVWGPVAKTDGHAPTWDGATAATCSNTWCHGPTGGGGSNNKPKWTLVDGSQKTCGTCHGLPPPAPHPASSSCSTCHDTVAADFSIVKPAQHIDGTVQLLAAASACNACHGNASATNPQPGDPNTAPPRDTLGNTATTFIGVGAHQAHLTGGRWSTVIACAQCHTVPTTVSHASQPLNLTWGAIATHSSDSNFAPTFTPGTATCASTWCHGPAGFGSTTPGSANGTNHAPVWNPASNAPAQAACGTCHGLPPSTGQHGISEASGLHTDCNNCHSGYLNGTTSGSVNKALHLNGTVEVGGANTAITTYSAGSCKPICHDTRNW